MGVYSGIRHADMYEGKCGECNKGVEYERGNEEDEKANTCPKCEENWCEACRSQNVVCVFCRKEE